MMRKIFITLVTFLCLTGLAPLSVALTEENPSAGLVKPSSPLWGLELAIERLQEDLTFNSNQKALLKLQHAHERISEMREDRSNLEGSVAEYNKLLAEIEDADINYDTALQVEDDLEKQSDELTSLAMEQDDNIITDARKNAVTVRDHAADVQDTILNGELIWWSNLAQKYPVDDAAISISAYVTKKQDIAKAGVPSGITQVTVIDSSGAVINRYVIVNEGTDVTISSGETTNPGQRMTVTIAEVRASYERYKGMFGL